MFGKLLAHYPETFVNQFAIAIVEIQSHPRWYADCNNCRALGSPGFAKGGGLHQSTGSRALLLQMRRSVSNTIESWFERATSVCASSGFACSDSRVIFRARHFFRSFLCRGTRKS